MEEKEQQLRAMLARQEESIRKKDKFIEYLINTVTEKDNHIIELYGHINKTGRTDYRLYNKKDGRNFKQA
jgi:hypothetical protein